MSNETDLGWLARNVHEWSDGMREVLVCYPRNVDTLIWSCVSSNAGWITKEQWLARRAELQNRPSWKDAPEWAEWLAQDEDGEWKWLAGLPGKYVDGWTAVKIKGCCKGSTIGDWRDTLEKRPADLSEQAVIARLKEATDNVLAAAPGLKSDRYKFEPFISIEDNQEQGMQQDNGWFERGELPPVGIKCQYVVSDRLSVEAEITAHAKLGLCFVQVGQSGESYVSKTAELHRFHPIRTERELAIEQALKDSGALECETVMSIIENLLDKGWVKEFK